MSQVNPILAKNLALTHGFFTRSGGVSTNPTTGEKTDLNCGLLSKDTLENLAENRNRVRQHLDADCLLSLHQIHSSKVVTVTERSNDWDFDQQADALVTNLKGVAIGAMSADCGPVLFHDPVSHIIGSAHAGWNGAIGGVLENTVEAMTKLGAEASHIHAALGPCIQQASYQVGPEFYQQFCARSPNYDQFFISSDKVDHWQFDLAGFVVARLKAMNLASVVSTGQDTCADAANFFSHRRGTLAGKPDLMRHISAIRL